MLAAACARGAVAELRRLRELDQLRHRLRRKLRIDDEHVRHAADERERREVLLQIQLEVLVDLRRDEELRSHHEPRVTVSRRTRYDVCTERSRYTRTRIDD